MAIHRRACQYLHAADACRPDSCRPVCTPEVVAGRRRSARGQGFLLPVLPDRVFSAGFRLLLLRAPSNGESPVRPPSGSLSRGDSPSSQSPMAYSTWPSTAVSFFSSTPSERLRSWSSITIPTTIRPTAGCRGPTWLVLPAMAAVGAVICLVRRQSILSVPNAEFLLFWQRYLLLSVLIMVFWQLVGQPVLQLFTYASYLMPAVFLAFGSQIAIAKPPPQQEFPGGHLCRLFSRRRPAALQLPIDSPLMLTLKHHSILS